MEAAEAADPTADAWRERIAVQRAGGQSIRAWCRDRSLPEHAFYAWRRRLGLSPAPPRKRRSRRADRFGFTEVVVDRAAARPESGVADPILLRFAGGRELVLPMSMPPRQIAALVRELEGAQ
jgi:transposase-like protein